MRRRVYWILTCIANIFSHVTTSLLQASVLFPTSRAPRFARRSGFLDEQDDEDKDDEARTKWRRLCPARTSLICLTLFFNNVTSKVS